MKQGMALAKIDSFDTKRLAFRLMTEAEWELFIYNTLVEDEIYITFGEEKNEELLGNITKPFYHNTIYYSLHLPDTNAMIGYVGYFTPKNQIEYYIFKDFRRQGYAFEAVGALVDMLTNGVILGKAIDEIRAWTVLENNPSSELLLKLGFQWTGYSVNYSGVTENNFLYSHNLVYLSN